MPRNPRIVQVKEMIHTVAINGTSHADVSVPVYHSNMIEMSREVRSVRLGPITLTTKRKKANDENMINAK
jgi:hypothetical protein